MQPSFTLTLLLLLVAGGRADVCGAGQYWSAPITACVSCPPGTYNALIGGVSGTSGA